MSYTRRASHAGPSGSGWYESIAEKLRKSVEGWMSVECNSSHLLPQRRLFGIIAPHAGLRFCGLTSGKAYGVLQQYLATESGAAVKNIFILGPSHHKGFAGMEVSDAVSYETPFGAIPVDCAVIKDILQRCRAKHIPVKPTSQKTDELEHSLELQMPFISALAANSNVRIVPIIVGMMDRRMEEDIGAVLTPYFEDPTNLFVFSSDFCHWGERFGYTYLYKDAGTTFPTIADAIQAMDLKAVELLKAKDISGWYDYLAQTENTICGRHSISVGMQYWGRRSSSVVQLQGYSQSNRVTSPKDGSVSYASAVIYV